MNYISTQSVKDAFEALKKDEFSNESILHIFFILKSCGFNELEAKPVSYIKDNGLTAGFALGSLFADNEKKPEKYDFINPFKLSSWSSQPTENLHKWVTLRIGNNVAGGARTWRKIVDYDPDEETIKFTYNYLENLKELTIDNSKIDLQGFALWTSRFTEFDEVKPTKHDLIRIVQQLYKLSENEMAQLFENSTDIKLTFSDREFDKSAIRNMVVPDGMSNEWLDPETILIDNQRRSMHMDIKSLQKFGKVSVDQIRQALDRFNNVMLSGPPATSKSYLAKQVSESYDQTVSIQFHPEYGYQDFIGGYFVNGDNVSFEGGLLTRICDEAKSNTDKKYLLIIDEVNRGNLSSILGEAIQCLDRGYATRIKVGSNTFDFSIPPNLHILATRNTTDKSLSNIDLAVYRRFIDFKIMPDPEVLADLVIIEGDVSARDLLNRINANLVKTTEDQDMQIGQALFLNESVKNNEGKYFWSQSDFEMLFTHSILPLVKEYCNGSEEKFAQVFNPSLLDSLGTEEFINSVKDYTLVD